MTVAHLQYVPDYLPETNQRRLEELTVESESVPAPLEINEYLIRHWCETLEDGNPLYLDEAYARERGHDARVAPFGSIMTAFTMQFRWPWPPSEGEPQRHIHYEVKELLDLPIGIISNIEVETGVRARVGDRISVSQRLVSISPWKKTRVGEGHFWVMERYYRNQDRELVITEKMDAFGYGRGEVDLPADGGGGWSPAVEDVLQGEKTGYSVPEYRTLAWADVSEGQELPELRMPITFSRCVYLASATRDFSPQHSNSKYAQERSRTRDVFVNTPFNLGMVDRYLIDWAGPEAEIKKIRVSMRGNVCAGDDMIMTGRVTKRYEQEGERLVDVEVIIATEEGPVTPCSATVALA
jgi:hypothetical protein